MTLAKGSLVPLVAASRPLHRAGLTLAVIIGLVSSALGSAAPALAAGFSVTLSGPDTVAVGGSVQLTATASSTSAGDEYLWDLDGDGGWDQRGSSNTATFTGTSAGRVRVTVRVYSGATGERADANQTMTVTDGETTEPTPVATISGPQQVREDQTVQLVAAVSPDSTSYGYKWDLDSDGAYDDATGKTATVDPKALGRSSGQSVTARVQVSRTAGSDIFSSDYVVQVTAAPTTIEFESAPYTVGTDGIAYMRAFTGQSHANDRFEWELDGDTGEQPYTDYLTTANNQVATFDNNVYKFAAGTYPVKVRLTSGRDGAYYYAQTTITVPGAVETAQVDAGGPYQLTKGSKVTLTATSSKATSKDAYAWDLDGDGTYKDAKGATATYDSTKFGKSVGEHTVKVRLVDGSGNTTYDTATVTINPLPSVTNTVAPRIEGAVGFDRVLTARTGTWGPTGVALSYQWLRNGKPIKNATKSQYTPGSGDLGATISVRVTGARKNYTSRSVDSASTGPVKTEPSLSAAITPGDGAAAVIVRVLAPGTTPQGTVRVSVGSITRDVPLSSAAKATIAIDGLAAGPNDFTVTYLGSDKVESISTTRTAIIR